MNEIFRPVTSRLEEINTSIELLGCVLAGQKAVYVAVPMTSGERFIRWFVVYGNALRTGSHEYNVALHRDVIEPNCLAAAARIAEIRRDCDSYVISPIALERPSWTQNDYRHLWGRVIERHVERAIFLDGWHYSSGCSYEFLVASWFGVATQHQDSTPIDLGEGIDSIKKSIAEMNRVGLQTDFQQNVLQQLCALQAQLTPA